MKSKINKKIFSLLVVFVAGGIFSMVGVRSVSATDPAETSYGSGVFVHVAHGKKNDQVNTVRIQIAGYIGGDIYANSGWHANWSLHDYDNTYKCYSDSVRIPGFCEELKATCYNTCILPVDVDGGSQPPGTCNTTDGCGIAIAEKYAKKLRVTLQAEVDALIGDAGLDNKKANDALGGCGGDALCIQKMLVNLQQEPDFVATNKSATGTTDPWGFSDILNTNIVDGGAINAAGKDSFGLQGKAPGPSVDVIFNSSGSLQGGTITTASAVAGYFNGVSAARDLYFTWYLKKGLCELTDKNHPTGKKTNSDGELVNIPPDSNNIKISSCDFDDDKIITVNDWKIAAIKTTMARAFDKSQANYSANIDNSTAGHTAIPEFDEQKGGVNIGWKKGFLRDGNDNVYEENDTSDDVANCYVQAPKSGRQYELRKTSDDSDVKKCPNGYHVACASDQSVSCNVLNPVFDNSVLVARDAAIAWNNDPENVKTVYNDNYGVVADVTPYAYAPGDVDYVEADAIARQAVVSANIIANAFNSDPDNEYLDLVADPMVVPALPDTNIAINGLFSACGVVSERSDEHNVFCSIKDNTDLENFKTTVFCKDAGMSVCVKDDNDGNSNTYLSGNIEAKNSLGKIFGVIVGTETGNSVGENDTFNNKMCNAVAKPDLNNSDEVTKLFISNSDPLVKPEEATCSFLRSAIINGVKDVDGNIIIAGNADLEPKCGVKKDVNLCKHLFPVLPKGIRKANGKQAVTGDGEFNIAEKQFWGADPMSEATDGKNKDEEKIAGLGMDKFEWTYSPGDQLGVVVEGDTAFKTDHAGDASYKRMWAFSNGTCKALENMEKESSLDKNDPDKNKRSFYIDGSMGIFTADVDLDNCLPENLLDPDTNSAASLSVQLNASPENPINDDDGKGDTLNIVASALGANQKGGELLYEWSVQKSRDGSMSPTDTTNWIDITSDMESEGSFSESDKSGIDRNDFAIKLNMPESLVASGMNNNTYNGGSFYLRVKVKITSVAGDGGQDAQGTIVVKVGQQGDLMHIYTVTVTDSGMLGLNKSDEICNDEQGLNICYATKNELLGMEVPNSSGQLSNFSWTVNGVLVDCKASISSECHLAGNKIFFPVLGNDGEAVNVVAKAVKNKNGLVESVQVSRNLVISRAGLQIKALDSNAVCGKTCLENSTACPKYLGFYKANGLQYPDCSTQVWETNEGKTVTFSAERRGGLDWSIDGQSMPEYENQETMSLLIEKKPGSNYTIGLYTKLLPEDKIKASNIRLALSKHWGISPESSVDDEEEEQEASMQLDVVKGSGQAVATANKGFFGASLITHLPEQLVFLFKISLTSIAMFLVTGLLFSFMPGSLLRKE